MLKLKKIVTK